MTNIKKSTLQALGMIVLFLLAVSLLWFSSTRSIHAVGATAAQVRFAGAYRIGDGPWRQITEGEHIPATKGDVTLRGNFHLYSPGGDYIGLFSGKTPLAFYMDHISLTFFEVGCEPYVMETENPMLGFSACGEVWASHAFSGGTEPIEVLIHNPHRFGNETAIDRMLDGIAIWDNILFERDVMAEGQMQRNVGLFLLMAALTLLGSALFSGLLHMPVHQIILLLGMTILSAGIYLLYSSAGMAFLSEVTAVNTAVLGMSTMFYMLFLSGVITYYLDSTRKAALLAATALAILDGVYILIPMVSGIRFYDILLLWVITQSIVGIVLLFCLIREILLPGKRNRLLRGGLGLMVAAFEADVIANAAGAWNGGRLSVYVFMLLFVAALFTVLRIIPEGINAAARTKELEMQHSRLEAEKNIMEAKLKESRISIMLSQIQPHFIYNTLGTIERMCLKDPQKAFELVRNFSLYLRGNFSELDSVSPIRFTEELKHVEYYVNIEKVRFPDMNIRYQIETKDFLLPALSVQPLVENAIKHGLMRLETGGTVLVRSYETPAHFCVEVIDDGVGFDVSKPMDEKKHVGIRNIRGRLKGMVNGELILESRVGAGTKAVILIPKEVDV